MLHRFPDGTDGETIYQKRLPKGAPDWVETVQVRFPSGRTADELCVTELASVDLGGADVDGRVPPLALPPGRHRASGRAAHRPRPAARHRLRRGQARWPGWSTRCSTSSVRSAGRRRRARGACTSTCGSSPRSGFAEVRRAALAFAREVERRVPELVTTAWWKEERGEQIFIDYNQNARDRTIASAYSVRASAAGAGVGAGHLGRAARRRDATTSRSRRCRRGSPSSATCTPGIDEAVFDHRAAAGVGRARRARPRAGRRAVPAELPEAGGRAAAGAAVAHEQGELEFRPVDRGRRASAAGLTRQPADGQCAVDVRVVRTRLASATALRAAIAAAKITAVSLSPMASLSAPIPTTGSEMPT